MKSTSAIVCFALVRSLRMNNYDECEERCKLTDKRPILIQAIAIHIHTQHILPIYTCFYYYYATDCGADCEWSTV